MKTSSPPKKPLTPFFLFKEKMKAKGETLSGKEAGAKWQALSESAKKVYVEEYAAAKAAYDKYLEETEGIVTKSSAKKKEKSTKYGCTRIMSVCTSKKSLKPMDRSIYQALAAVTEQFMMDFSKAILEQCKQDDKKLVTVDVVTRTIENGGPKFGFILTMDEYAAALKDAEVAVAKEKETRAMKREKKKEEESESEDEGKKGKGKKDDKEKSKGKKEDKEKSKGKSKDKK